MKPTLCRPHRGRAAAPFCALLAGLLGSASAPAQTFFLSDATATARHTEAGVVDPFTADDANYREGSSAFGRLDARADSDGDAQEYNGFGHAWSQVDVAGVHIYTFGMATAGGAAPS